MSAGRGHQNEHFTYLSAIHNHFALRLFGRTGGCRNYKLALWDRMRKAKWKRREKINMPINREAHKHVCTPNPRALRTGSGAKKIKITFKWLTFEHKILTRLVLLACRLTEMYMLVRRFDFREIVNSLPDHNRVTNSRFSAQLVLMVFVPVITFEFSIFIKIFLQAETKLSRKFHKIKKSLRVEASKTRFAMNY